VVRGRDRGGGKRNRVMVAGDVKPLARLGTPTIRPGTERSAGWSSWWWLAVLACHRTEAAVATATVEAGKK